MKTNHEKVVASWDKVLEVCNAHGSKYNPSSATLKTTALSQLLTSSREALEAVSNAENQLILAINNRQRVFKDLPRLGTRIINALAVTDATAELIADANRYRMRFRYPATDKSATDAQGQDNGVSASDKSRGPLSYLDFDSKMKNLKALIKLVESVASYQPNEADLQIEALSQVLADLINTHKAVAQTELALKNARIARNQILYGESGVRERAKLVKKYFRSAFGSNSPVFNHINGIQIGK
jgi:hypothetical protein